MNSIAGNLLELKARIAKAATVAKRDSAAITLIAASKTQSAEVVNAAYQAGVRHFGENYLDEALTKVAAVDTPNATWHFIGRVQSNKTRLIAGHFDWVHTVDRVKIAKRLSSHREGNPLNALIQVNIDNDPAKAGAKIDDVETLVGEVAALPNLRLRGLMAILSQATDPDTGYQSMAQLALQLKAQLAADDAVFWDTLSIGMSGDMNSAIAAGATHVRIGTALFGPRAS